MKEIEIVKEYLQSQRIDITPAKLSLLAEFCNQLIEMNAKVNLISRRTDHEKVWFLHILDSLLIVKAINFSQETILDFGTGGGLPGIPIKILFPEIKMHLLDSRSRKTQALKKIVKKLDLTDCFPITSRLEDIVGDYRSGFDVVLCRSVKQEERYKQALYKLLKVGGRIYLYKSNKIDDLEIYPEYLSYDVSHPLVGKRQIIEIQKEMFHMEHKREIWQK